MEKIVKNMIVNVDDSSRGKGHLKNRLMKEVENTSIYVENSDMALREAKVFLLLESNIGIK